MGLAKFLRSIFGERKKFEPPEVTFIEDDTTGVTHTIPITVSMPHKQIIIKNHDEYFVYKSKDDIPPELLEEIEHLEDLGTVDSYSVIIDGQREIYKSYDDIPEEIKKAISKMEES